MKLQELKTTLLIEMANLPPKLTGLNHIVFLGVVGGQHGPRIKVSNIKGTFSKDNFTIQLVSKQLGRFKITGDVKISSSDLNLIYNWISLNLEKILTISRLYELGLHTTEIEDETTQEIKQVSLEDLIQSLTKI